VATPPSGPNGTARDFVPRSMAQNHLSGVCPSQVLKLRKHTLAPSADWMADGLNTCRSNAMGTAFMRRAAQGRDADAAAAGQPAQGRRDGGDARGAGPVPAGGHAGRRRRGRAAAAHVPGAAGRHRQARVSVDAIADLVALFSLTVQKHRQQPVVLAGRTGPARFFSASPQGGAVTVHSLDQLGGVFQTCICFGAVCGCMTLLAAITRAMPTYALETRGHFAGPARRLERVRWRRRLWQ